MNPLQVSNEWANKAVEQLDMFCIGCPDGLQDCEHCSNEWLRFLKYARRADEAVNLVTEDRKARNANK